MTKNEDKKIFLVASGDENRVNTFSEWIRNKFNEAVVYTASDYTSCISKLMNVPTQLLILDFDLPDARAGEILDRLIVDRKSTTAILAIGSKINSEKQSDAVAMGKLFFIDAVTNLEAFEAAIAKISNFAFYSEAREFKIISLQAGDILIREGDSNNNVFILRKGEMVAYTTTSDGVKKTLGHVYMGEFVGEMAYFIGDNRIASRSG